MQVYLDYENPDLLTFVEDNLLDWIEKYRNGSEDGFRGAIDLLNKRIASYNRIRGNPNKAQARTKNLFIA